MQMDILRRIYAFSDTYGRSKNPFLQDDADALLSTDFRSFPLEPVRREFDIYGRENITGHIVRLIFALNDYVLSPECPHGVQEEFKKTITGIFINAAPRLNKENGALFHVATAGNIRIVTTDLASLSTVKHRIETLSHLPNLDNNLYGPTEQFRSSYTAYLLHPEHNMPLEKDPIDKIPDYADDRWELAYVDRFGNLISYCNNVDQRWKEVAKAAEQSPDKVVRLLIGNVSQKVYAGSSLRDAEPGSLVVYENGNIDILRKWMAEEDSYTRLYKSAYFQFAKPEVGAKIQVLAE